ncbi:H-NS histone family protein [Candidatus Contendibacter odensensis]|uniref:DNA-binding protein H-NS-like C-terminal domain-containing protein n=1 Tax=Candidatus Contendobacter odensis Run_B_J11 TaxID=1400861 RepID=A0A7U7J485_9GAMM|nr:H-NS histone family protein [Candidatus Contendobacter odensis]CDH46971.1 hypothetical protein BN874_690021 [Candidatus Contendobacter odensis Run_B_J11]
MSRISFDDDPNLTLADRLDALTTIRDNVDAQITAIRQDIRDQILKLNALINPQPVKVAKVRPPKPPRYANPDDPLDTWSGYGRRPPWFQKATRDGIDPETLEIPGYS